MVLDRFINVIAILETATNQLVEPTIRFDLRYTQ